MEIVAARERARAAQRKPSRGTLKILHPDHPAGEIFRSEFRICIPHRFKFSEAG
jgi:hypothetical protein